jgi:hypothetical protein
MDVNDVVATLLKNNDTLNCNIVNACNFKCAKYAGKGKTGQITGQHMTHIGLTLYWPKKTNYPVGPWLCRGVSIHIAMFSPTLLL